VSTAALVRGHNVAVAYDEDIANRIREVVAGEAGVTEKRMFGGLAFLINGNMSVSASGRGGILLRVDPAETKALIADPHAERAVMGGRTMDGWLRVDVDALPDDEVETWIARGVAYARSLPAK
jgi:TfoX/Sxy family transcriptional regulator of competence genes